MPLTPDIDMISTRTLVLRRGWVRIERRPLGGTLDASPHLFWLATAESSALGDGRSSRTLMQTRPHRRTAHVDPLSDRADLVHDEANRSPSRPDTRPVSSNRIDRVNVRRPPFDRPKHASDLDPRENRGKGGRFESFLLSHFPRFSTRPCEPDARTAPTQSDSGGRFIQAVKTQPVGGFSGPC